MNPASVGPGLLGSAMTSITGDPAHVQTYLGHLRVREYAQATIEDRERLLQHWATFLPVPLFDATPRHVQAYFDRPGWSAQTRQTYLGHIRGFYKWAVQQELILADPTRLTGPMRSPSPWSALPIRTGCG